jgi:hypothetical protein
MEVTEEMIFTFAARFMNMRWAGEVIYGTDYEAHDTNYRIAVMTKAKELVPTNSIVENLIIKEVIAMLAPNEDIPQYEQAYINTIQDPEVKELMKKNNEQVLSRDLGNQIPTPEQFGEDQEIVGDDIAGDDYGSDELNEGGYYTGIGTPVLDTGQSYYTQQAIAKQINVLNTGR